MPKIIFAIIFTLFILGGAFANDEYDAEYMRVSNDYDLVDRTSIDLDFPIGEYATIVVYDALGAAVVMVSNGDLLDFSVYRKPGSSFELISPIDEVARAMVCREVLDATRVVYASIE